MGANLFNHDLSGANLTRANLANSNLSHSSLAGANLTRAVLSGADLSFAIFRGADLTSTDLSRANLYFAAFGETILVGATLLGTKHSETTIHIPGSYVDHAMVVRSPGLSDYFLLRCGLTEADIISYRKKQGLRAMPERENCFISYANSDKLFAGQLCSLLQSRGIDTWFAQHDLKIGDRFPKKIKHQILARNKFILILSPAAARSHWVGYEVTVALEHERKGLKRDMILPVRILRPIQSEEQWVADILAERHVYDVPDWTDHREVEKLAAILASILRGD